MGDAFFTRIDPALVGSPLLLYATYVGGTEDDQGLSLAVGIATINGTAVAGSDYGATNATLIFAPGATTASVQIPLINDLSDETNETFSVTLSNPFNSVLGTQTSQTVTITDDDPAPTISWQNSAISASEAGGNGALTVQLNVPSSFNVTVNYATANGTATASSDYTSVSGSLTQYFFNEAPLCFPPYKSQCHADRREASQCVTLRFSMRWFDCAIIASIAPKALL